MVGADFNFKAMISLKSCMKFKLCIKMTDTLLCACV